jgi:histidyl-tRNA synthetase
MIGRLLGHDVPACGFSIGFERVVAILLERNGLARQAPDRIALVFERDAELADVVRTAARVRRDGRAVSLTLRRKNLAKQLDDLARDGFGAYAMFRPGQAAPELRPLVLRTPERSDADA